MLQRALSQGYRRMPAEALIAGSVDEVAEQFRTFGEIGYTDILVRHLTNDQPKVLGSLERLAAVRAAVAKPALGESKINAAPERAAEENFREGETGCPKERTYSR